jgi:pimeloyl-ACP methyl ester carboxylesterase
VGHSFGSTITSTLGANHPDLTDGIVVTGFSTNASFAVVFAISSTFEIAADMEPDKWGNLSNGYLTWPDKQANQYSFLTWPYFSPGVLDAAESKKPPFRVSEFLTALPMPAPEYDGPLLAYTPLCEPQKPVICLTYTVSMPCCCLAIALMLPSPYLTEPLLRNLTDHLRSLRSNLLRRILLWRPRD